MKIKYIILSIALCLTTLFSCKKGNDFTYDQVNELMIKGPQEQIVVEQQQILKIEPEITESMAGGGPYTYKWEMYLTTTTINSTGIPVNTSLVTLSEERNLNKAINVAPGSYWLQYTITDTKTGLRTMVRYSAIVNSKYYEGWIVLSEKAGKSDVSFVRKDEVVFTDLITASNPTSALNGKILGVYAGVHVNLQDLSVFTEKGYYLLSANDFTLKPTFNKDFDFFTEPLPGTFSSGFYATTKENQSQFLIVDGKIYIGANPSYGFGFAGYSSELVGPAGYSVFPYMMNTSAIYQGVFYDNTTQQFVYSTLGQRTLNVATKMGKTMVGGDRTVDNESILIMKDNAGYYVCRTKPENVRIGTTVPPVAEPIGIAPEIEKAKYFAASELNIQLYYAADNKIYLYEGLGKKARVVYTFPANIQVKDMKMFKSAPGWGPANPLYSKRLVVATYNGTEGELYYFDLSAIGEIVNNTFQKKYGGFGDIKQINYRHPNM